MSQIKIRYVRLLTAFALGAIAGCGADALTEDEAPLRKPPDPGAIAGKDLATAHTTIPFSYMTESDRYLVFADLLFDALAPVTTERHRLVLRLDDINPSDDVSQIQAVAEYLSSQGIPFGFGVIPQYEDPLGFYNNGTPQQARLDQAPALVTTLNYMLGHGGVMVMHGYTHQWDATINPYTGVTADDNEFYRVIENPDLTLNFVGPVIEDSLAWAGGRMDTGRADFTRAHLTAPSIFEVPHYAGSVNT
ncbi:MAG TPA: DUF2334 domain-containing protein [Kofleriaceae bacterium]|jgi:uncharacterized protein YdaL|nr:DUF2334 domain-containing protein [Kofleriaceae bacterium]